jgi:hypothetical protein
LRGKIKVSPDIERRLKAVEKRTARRKGKKRIEQSELADS